MSVTRFPEGVSANDPDDMQRDMPITDPARTVIDFNDFTRFPIDSADATDYAFDEVSGGTVGASGDAVGGRITFTSGASAGSGGLLYGNNRSFEIQPGKKLWFEVRLQISGVDPDNQGWLAGVTDDETIPIGPTNGIYFTKASGASTVQFICVHQGQVPFSIDVDVGDIVADQDYTYGFYFDGEYVEWYVNGERLGRGTVPEEDLPFAELGITLGMQNVIAGADRELIVDYYTIVSEEVRG